MSGARGPAQPSSQALRDARVVLPVALLLLLVLTTFALLSYRNGIELLIADRQDEALRVAQAIAGDAGGLSMRELRPAHPDLVRVVVADRRGVTLRQTGEPLGAGFAAPLGGALPDHPIASRPTVAEPVVAAYLPLGGNRGEVLRLDLRAATLAVQAQTVRVLTFTGFGASSAVLLWLILFLRQLLRPYENLLAKARELGGDSADDEAAMLLATVERALADARREHAAELAVLEETLGPSVEGGMLLLDRDGRVLALNPEGARLLGPAPPPRTPLAELLARHPELLSLLGRAVAEGAPIARHQQALGSGGALQVELSLTPLRRSGGEPLGFLVLLNDLTATHRAAQQERLAESLAQLGELSAGVAHELRNGLATVRGYVALLERGGGDERAEYLAELRNETQHLERVVADFLSFARPETARLVPLDLPALVRHAVADPAFAPGVVVFATPAQEAARPAMLTGDSQLLVRALRNLLRNAVEASQRSGTAAPVEVTAGWTGDAFAVTVGDRGPGIAAEQRTRLFQPFASDRPGGVGLGLALAHRIVTLHGGTLTLEDRPGGGACARVTFPASRFATSADDRPSSDAQRR